MDQAERENKIKTRPENGILLIRPVLDAYGVSKILLQLAVQLKTMGYKVVCASDNNDIFKSQIEQNGIRHYQIPFRTIKKSMFGVFNCYFKLNAIIRDEKIKIIHSHHRWSSFICYFLSRRLRIPLITSYHGIHHGKKFFSLWGDKIISVSEDARRHLIEYFKVQPSLITVIHNGIKMPTMPETAPHIINNFHLKPEQPITIVNIARLSPEKDQKSLFLAIKQVLKKFPSLRLLMVGSGPLEGELKALAMDLGINRNVEFIGEIEDVSPVLADMDLMVLNSLTEGLPLSVLEALSYAKPVVATSVGDIPKVLSNGQNGYLVPPGEPEKLATTIEYCLKNREISLQMAKKGAKFVRENFSVEQMALKTEQVYLDLLE